MNETEILGKKISFVDESDNIELQILILKMDDSYLYVSVRDDFEYYTDDVFEFVEDAASLTSTLANLLIPLDDGDIHWQSLQSGATYRPDDIPLLVDN